MKINQKNRKKNLRKSINNPNNNPFNTGKDLEELGMNVIQELESRRNFRRVRRWITICIGGTVLIIGIAMIVLPGPAIIVIPLGLAILSGELLWARKYLAFIKKKLGLEKVPPPNLPE